MFVKALLNAKADVHAKDSGGNSALIFAAKDGCVRTIRILINANASVNYVDNGGRTALKIAQENDNDEFIPLLSAHDNLSLPPAVQKVE